MPDKEETNFQLPGSLGEKEYPIDVVCSNTII